MADVLLAEYRGGVWLVSGERYIDDLLANTLPANISIEFVACVSHADVNGLWAQNCGEPSTSGAPWMIHPAIVNRVRRTSGGYSIFFGQWSAMLDDDARSVIRTVADGAQTCVDAELVLTSYMNSGSPRMISDLANLRRGMIEVELVALGVASSRLVCATREMTGLPEVGLESGRIDIDIRTR